MTAMDFPLNPNNGDTHNSYVYDATHGVWNQNPQQLAARFISSDTAPSSPSTGDAWFDTETGKTYIYHDSSWVESGNPVIGFVDPYDQTTTSTGYLALPKGTSAQRPVTPNNGDIRFNTELGEPEYYSEALSEWFLFRQQATNEFAVSYLVVAGGGGGGWDRGGGGGAGGYRSNVSGENSGGGAVPESDLNLTLGTYTLEVGAGGPGALNIGSSRGGAGFDSIFSSITSLGGGGGATSNAASSLTGGDGGSGGGGARSNQTVGGSGETGQGFGGGQGNDSNPERAGGGGGSDAVGANGSSSGNGGAGVSSSITGSAVTRAGGGGGGANNTSGGSGAADGGNGGSSTSGGGSVGGNAVINSGSGGGGGGEPSAGGSGGSGVVIFKIPSSVSVSFSVGLTEANGGSGQTIGDNTVYRVTEGTGTVTFS
jgi:hypothetical protein